MPLSTRSDIPDLRRLTAKLKRDLPIIIANKSKNHYLEGFRRGGYMTDKSSSGWVQRKKEDRRPGRRAILVTSGALRNDLDVRKTTFEEIILGTSDTIYGSVHNNGERAGRGAGFNMPQREFLGDSRSLEAKILTLIKRKMRETYG